MSLKIPCPHCGLREAEEFRWGGEARTRPGQEAPAMEWVDYSFLRKNLAGMQKEWWYHRLGCGKWFTIERDTLTNKIGTP
jgi:sarcosine oxidase subunit delta